MALAANALIGLSDLKIFMSITSSSQDTQLESAIGYASTLIESYLERQITTRGSLIEYHSIEPPASCELYLGEWPIISVTSVYEDMTRVYATALVADTDYIVSKPGGKLIRVEAGSGTLAWLSGFRTVKVVYEAGRLSPGASTPEGATAVPLDLAQICAEVAATIFQDADRKEWGKLQVSSEGRTITRFMGYMTPDLEQRLAPHRRSEVSQTWDRDVA
jgi:hypothetical protein